MKLLPIKKRKIAVLFTAGLGDALLFIPLLKALKHKNFSITGLFYSPFDNDCIFDNSLLDKKIHFKSKAGLLLYSITHPKHFENAYINHLGVGKFAAAAMKRCSKRITVTQNLKGKRNRNILVQSTDAEQNLHLLYTEANARINDISSFYFPAPQLKAKVVTKFLNKRKNYVIIQVSAGNNTTPYKNWPMDRWANLVFRLCKFYPSITFVIAGDRTEKNLSDFFSRLPFKNYTVLIGKTTVAEIFNLIAASDGYIGLDSGLMHMAVALQKKTLTLFCASNEKLYGYQNLDPVHHTILAARLLSCRPCSAWKNANTSRVIDPALCPDFACTKAIGVAEMFKKIEQHFNWPVH